MSRSLMTHINEDTFMFIKNTSFLTVQFNTIQQNNKIKPSIFRKGMKITNIYL